MNDPARGPVLAAARRAFDLGELSPAETRVLAEALEGCTVREISDRLVLSEATVRSHLGRIYAKLGVRGRVELLARLAEAGSDAQPVRDPFHPSDDAGPARTPEGSLVPILMGVGLVLVFTLLVPFAALVTAPGLAVGGILASRSAPGSATRRAVPLLLLAALLAAAWGSFVLLSLGVSTQGSVETGP